MNNPLLLTILIATPGLLFDIARRLVSRAGSRTQRDLTRLIAETILVAAPIYLASMVAFELAQPGLSVRVVEDLTGRWGGTCSHGCGLDHIIKRQTAFFTLAACLAAMAGLIVGKILVWWIHPSGKFGTPADKLYSGYLCPIMEVSVLANTKLYNGPLIYRGLVELIQIGPEGRIDYVMLADPRKSQLRDFSHFAGRKLASRLAPQSIKPFVPIGSDTDGALKVADGEVLLIESEDIANVFLRVSKSTGTGDFVDKWMHRRFGSKTLQIPATPKDELPPSRKKPPNP